jgi:hypothetical protein
MTTHIDLSLPSEWDSNVEMMDEELSATSSEEASKVFDQWQTDDQEQDLDIMEIDEQIGSNLLGDDIFNDPCASPTGPLEELTCLQLDEAEVDKFSLSLFTYTDDGDVTTSSLPFEERYKATLKKLAESMKRSQETRKVLTIKTPKMESYPRSSSVTGVVKSIENSTHQLQIYLKGTVRA